MLQNPYVETIKTFSDLIPLSDWAEPSIKIVREQMKVDGAHDEAHLLRVVRNALWLADDVEGEYDRDVLIPACLLHDLINIPKDNPDRKLASREAAKEGCLKLFTERHAKSAEQDMRVYHAIHAHSYSANIVPLTIEGKALQDADRIDSLGYIGMVRLFSVGGSLGRSLFHGSDPTAKGRNLEEDKYTLDHFYTKLVHLPDTMQTELGRKIANIKVGVMLRFIEQLVLEIDGHVVTNRG